MKILKIVLWIICEAAVLFGTAWIGGKMGEILANIVMDE